MRLIDADALMQEYARFVAPSNNSDFEDVPTWNDAVSLLGSAPTIEPQRMRGKGRWNVYYHGEENGKSIFSYSCNQCGYGAPYNFIGGVCEQKKWNFCPNCGADMRGEQDDDNGTD